jgi:hypothetical protein
MSGWRVLEHRDACLAQRGADAPPAVRPVVVAEHRRDAPAGAQAAERAGDRLGRDPRPPVEEVAEEQRGVGLAGVHGGDEPRDPLGVDEAGTGVQVGHERDADARERVRPAREGELALADAQLARLAPQRAPGDGRQDGGRPEGEAHGAATRPRRRARRSPPRWGRAG